MKDNQTTHATARGHGKGRLQRPPGDRAADRACHSKRERSDVAVNTIRGYYKLTRNSTGTSVCRTPPRRTHRSATPTLEHQRTSIVFVPGNRSYIFFFLHSFRLCVFIVISNIFYLFILIQSSNTRHTLQ